jgi:hypothetical protein
MAGGGQVESSGLAGWRPGGAACRAGVLVGLLGRVGGVEIQQGPGGPVEWGSQRNRDAAGPRGAGAWRAKGWGTWHLKATGNGK